MFIKSGHVLYCFCLCCLFPFESIREKRENKTHRKISHSTVFHTCVWAASPFSNTTHIHPETLADIRTNFLSSINPAVSNHVVNKIKTYLHGCPTFCVYHTYISGLPYYPAYNTHPIDNTHPLPKSLSHM